jgi:hypothetical protein
MENLKADDFTKHINSKFKIYRTNEEVFEAELVEVAELRNNDSLYCFAVEFLLPAEFGFEQRIYKIEHPEMETMELFIVPVGQTESGTRFEAIFNRAVKK